MPPDTRRQAQSEKRERGEISCAECRRLKLKCDRKLPCSTCIRRGCHEICPNGTLSGGHGSRFILANTEKLHRKIEEMSLRIRQLEDALAILQASVSNEKHPLLREEMRKIKTWPEEEDAEANRNDIREQTDEVIDALGTLTIGDKGEAKYFGRTAGSEVLLYTETDSHSYNDLLNNDIPNITTVSLPDIPPEAIPETLENCLPEMPRAWTLCETYFEHLSWYCQPITRDAFVNELMIPIYKSIREEGHTPGSTALGSPHKLAAVYLLFSLGAVADLTLEPYNDQARHYATLGRAALGLRSIADSPAIETVQAVALMAMYHGLSGKETAESAWAFISISCRMGQSIGLHRDCARWGLDAKTVQKRRTVFWEIYSADIALSLQLGRPPTTPLSFIDCELPLDEQQSLTDEGELIIGFWHWKYTMQKELGGVILERTVTPQPPSYDTILQLDKQIREKFLPKKNAICLPPDHPDYSTPSICMRQFCIVQLRLITSLYVHRPFFAQSLLDHPINPLRSRFAPSYLAAFRTASVMIRLYLHFFARCPNLFLRIGSFWSHAYSATMIMGFVVTRTPKSTMAGHAFTQFCLGFDLLEKGAASNVRAHRTLHIIRKLRDRVFRIYAHSREPAEPSGSEPWLKPKAEDDEDGLAVFGGQTRVLASKQLSQRWSRTRRELRFVSGDARDGSSVSVTDENQPTSLPLPPDVSKEMHPSLVQYLSDLPGSGSSGALPQDGDFSMFDWNFESGNADFLNDISFPESDMADYTSVFDDAFRDMQQHCPSAPLVQPPSVEMDTTQFDSRGFAPTEANHEGASDSSFLGPVDTGLWSARTDMDPQWLSLMQQTGLLDNPSPDLESPTSC